MKNISLPHLLLLLVTLAGCNSSTVKTNDDDIEIPVERAGTDVLAGQSWHLENIGQNSFAGSNGIAGQDANIKEAIALGFRGTGIKVAVSDSGVDLTNPDLNDNALTGYHRDYSSSVSGDWQDSAADPYPDELDGHGTAVTGLIAAEGWNTIGSRGVAPEAKFAGFYYIGDFGDTVSSYEAKTLDQLFGNFDIFNYSYGFVGCTFVPTEDSIIDGYKQGVLNLRGGKGAIYVKAAGNDYIGNNSDCYVGDTSNYLGNTNANEDQNIPYIIMTAAANAKGQIGSYSTPGSGLWITSLGGEFGQATGSSISWGNRLRQLRGPAMISTDIVGCNEGLSTSSSTDNNFNNGNSEFNSNCDYTNIMNASSSAAPVLSGIIALMLEANPYLNWRDVKHILAESAEKINYSTAAYSHPAGLDISGHAYDFNYVVNAAGYSFSNTYGFGRVNASAAVVRALSYFSNLGTYEETYNPNNDGWYYSSGVVNVAIPDTESPTGAVSTIIARHNFNIESVQIRFSTDHTFIGDLGVELVSPSGTRSKLLLINSNIQDSTMTDYKMISNAFYGESSRGTWTLHVLDGVSGDSGNIISWDLKINGHKVTTSDSTAPNAPSVVINSSTELSLTDSPAVSFTGSTSPDVMRYEVAIGTLPSNEDEAAWFSIGNSTSFTVTGMNLSNQLYYIKIRAIDTSENISSVTTSTWTAGI